MTYKILVVVLAILAITFPSSLLASLPSTSARSLVSSQASIQSIQVVRSQLTPAPVSGVVRVFDRLGTPSP